MQETEVGVLHPTCVEEYDAASAFLHFCKQKRMLTKVDETDAMIALRQSDGDDKKALAILVERNRVWAEFGPGQS